MKLYLIALIFLLSSGFASAQSLNFARTAYFTRALPGSLTRLVTTGATLTGFNYSGADTNLPLFQDGLFFPIVDFQGNNLWVRLRHIAADANGRNVGINVTATSGDPFREGLGGWGGFLYQFDIFSDSIISGTASNKLGAPFETNITVESLETLSSSEYLNFRLLNAQASAWALNSKNFTGRNPGSNPGFSDTAVSWPIGPNPRLGYTTQFPDSSKVISVIDYGGASYAEFRMSADRVSSFTYGYEYPDGGGYQGMNLLFGIPSATSVKTGRASGLSLNAYPTATDGQLTVDFVQPAAQKVSFYLVDALGHRSLLGSSALKSGQEGLSLAGHPAGLYWLVMEGATGMEKVRVVKL